MKRAVIYVRSSGKSNMWQDGAGQGKISTVVQLDELKKLAITEGYTVVENGIYEDNGYSCITYPSCFSDAASSDEKYQHAIPKLIKDKKKWLRPALGALMDRIVKKKDFEYILIRNETRLLRPLQNTSLASKIYGRLEINNVKIHCAQGGRIIDASNFSDFFQSLVMSAIEINSMLEKIDNSKSSRIKKRDSGRTYASLNTLGFVRETYIENGIERKRYVQDKNIEFVVDMFNRFVNGASLITLVRSLQERRIESGYVKSKRAHPAAIRKLLKNPQYSYKLKNSKGEVIDWIDAPTKTPPVPYHVWKKTQEMLADNATKHIRTRKRVHTLSPILKCACGASMHACKYIETSYGYKCDRKSILNQCSISNIKANEKPIKIKVKKGFVTGGNAVNFQLSNLDHDYKESMLTRYQLTACDSGLEETVMPFVAFEIIRRMKDSAASSDILSKIALLDTDIDKLKKVKKTLGTKLLNGLISEEELDEMLKDMQAKEQSLNSQKTQLESDLSRSAVVSDSSVKNAVEGLAYHKIDKEEYRQLAKEAINQITIGKDKIVIDMKGRQKIEMERYKYKKSMLPPASFLTVTEDLNVTIYLVYPSYYKNNQETEVYKDSSLVVKKLN